jgi:transcriptional regulator with XRE-family HTH domain
MKSHVSKLIKSRRIEMGLTQAFLAKELGWKSVQHISNYERGIGPVPLAAFKTLTQILNISKDELCQAWLKDKEQLFWEAIK